MKNEAAVVIGAVNAALIAVITAVALTMEWDTTVTGAVIGAVSAVVAAVGAIVTRGRVYSKSSVASRDSEIAVLQMDNALLKSGGATDISGV